MDKKLIFSIIKKSKIVEKNSKILEFCSLKTVLDVGCVGQDFSYENPNWLHNRIKRVATHIDGVDIIQEGIDILRQKGYSVYHANELTTNKRKYDIILMSDVIEHINNPVSFLTFYSSYLNSKGTIIITTPNAHGVRNFTNILIRNDYSLNPEHTFWFCPKTLTEVVNRANLKFVELFWLKEYFTLKDVKGIKQKTIHIINSIFIRVRRRLCPNFMYIIALQ